MAAQIDSRHRCLLCGRRGTLSLRGYTFCPEHATRENLLWVLRRDRELSGPDPELDAAIAETEAEIRRGE